MNIDDVKMALTNGTYGEYGQWTKVTVKNMLNWTRMKWDEIKRRKIFEDDAVHREVVDLRNTPYGKAIIWKMNNIKTEDWSAIPLRDIAIAIKEGANMIALAKDYNIELKI